MGVRWTKLFILLINKPFPLHYFGSRGEWRRTIPTPKITALVIKRCYIRAKKKKTGEVEDCNTKQTTCTSPCQVLIVNFLWAGSDIKARWLKKIPAIFKWRDICIRSRQQNAVSITLFGMGNKISTRLKHYLIPTKHRKKTKYITGFCVFRYTRRFALGQLENSTHVRRKSWTRWFVYHQQNVHYVWLSSLSVTIWFYRCHIYDQIFMTNSLHHVLRQDKQQTINKHFLHATHTTNHSCSLVIRGLAC